MIEKRSFWIFLLLNFVTCGIYGIIFMYKLVEDLNKMFEGDGQESPNYIVVILLTAVTCGIYGIIWYYKLGERFSNNASRYGLVISINGITLVLLSMFINIVALYLVIDNTNRFADAYNRFVR